MYETCSLCGAATDGVDNSTSMRICDECSRALPGLCGHLESLDYAAALVARDLTIVYSNSRLCEISRLCGDDSVGRSLGEALGCAHLETSLAQGETHACPQCWLRRAVELARISGERLPEIRIDFALKTGSRASYKISAERAGEAVLLAIRPQSE